MDLELLSNMIVDLALDHDNIDLPGLGAFIVSDEPATFSDRGYTINPPYRRFSFSQNYTGDECLVECFARYNMIDASQARSILKEYFTQLQEVLKIRKTVMFPGLGRLRSTKEYDFFFVPDEKLELYPDGLHMGPVSLKTHVETAEEVAMAVSELSSFLAAQASPGAQPEHKQEVAAEKAVIEPEPEQVEEPEAASVETESEPEPRPEPVVVMVEEQESGQGAELETEPVEEHEQDEESESEPEVSAGEPVIEKELEQEPKPDLLPEDVPVEEELAVEPGPQPVEAIEPEPVSEEAAVEPEPEVPAEKAVIEPEPEQVEEPEAASVETESEPEPRPEPVVVMVEEQESGQGAELETEPVEEHDQDQEPEDITVEAELSAEPTVEAVAVEDETVNASEPVKAYETVIDIKPEPESKPEQVTKTAGSELSSGTPMHSVRWWAILLIIVGIAAFALVAFIVLAHVAPDFIDSILYTPEELRIINY